MANGRTEQAIPIQVIGTNFSCPIYDRIKTKKESKAYILIFSYSVSRAVYSKLTPNATTQELK